MKHFSFRTTNFQGVYLIQPFYSEDNRGSFLKSFEKDIFRDNGIEFDVTEDFESKSYAGVIRGLHFQTINPQAKLVRCQYGKVFDVIVDLRKNSPTFGNWESFILSSDNNYSLYIPAGFAHGFLALTDLVLLNYKCCGKYSVGSDSGIYWNDKDLDIKWPITINPIISKRDSELMSFKVFKQIIKGL